MIKKLKLLLSFFLFCSCSFAGDFYGVDVNVATKLAEMNLSGLFGVAQDADTPTAYKVTIDGADGSVNSEIIKSPIIRGGTGSGDDLTFETTTDVTKGDYVFSELSDGILKSASGVVSTFTDSSANWDSAYTHSQLVTGNPHAVTQTEVGLGNVENTALSTWTGATSITTLGTIGTGTWQGTPIADTYLASTFLKNIVEDLTPELGANLDAKGNTIYGNSTAGGNLTLESTSDATKGKIYFDTNSFYDKNANMWSFGSTSPNAFFYIDTHDTILFTKTAGGNLGTNSLTYAGSTNFSAFRYNGTFASPTGLLNGNVIYRIGASGHNGTALVTTAKAMFEFKATENWGVSANGIDISIYTTENGTTARTEKVTIAHNGNVGIGATNPLSTLEINGTQSDGTPTELTIATGAITATRNYHTVDTQADAVTDDLVTINGGLEGRILQIYAANTARTVVVKHGTGNIFLEGGVDFSINTDKSNLTLRYRNGVWTETSRVAIP